MVGDRGVEPRIAWSQTRRHTPRPVPVVPRTGVEPIPIGLKGRRSPLSQQGAARRNLGFLGVHEHLRDGGLPGIRTQRLRIKSPVPLHRCVQPAGPDVRLHKHFDCVARVNTTRLWHPRRVTIPLPLRRQRSASPFGLVGIDGGACRTRTGHLLLARQALFQMS